MIETHATLCIGEAVAGIFPASKFIHKRVQR